jgi:hypothetical protein
MASKKAISKEVATEEVTKWLDLKRIRDNKREASKPYIDEMVYAIMDGSLVLKENNGFTQKLLFPVKIKGENGDEMIKEINFMPRMAIGELNIQLKKVDAEDNDARLLMHIVALTLENTGVIKKLETSDYKTAQAITMFFL